MSDNIIINTTTESINLSVNTNTDVYSLSVVNVNGASRWGLIVGSLSAQTDLWRFLSGSNVSAELLTLSGNVIVINSLINLLSGNWNNSYSNLVSNSAAYLSSVNLNFLSVSGNWNNSYNWVVSNSANATFRTVSAISLSGVFYGDGSNLIGASLPGQANINTLVRSNSANWDTAYNTALAYQSVSGSYATNTLLQSTSALLIPLTTTSTLTSQLVKTTDLNNLSATLLTRTDYSSSSATLLPTTVYQNTSGSFVTNTLLQSTSALLTPLTLTRTLTSQLVLSTAINSLTGNWNSAYASTTALNLSSGNWNSAYTTTVSNSGIWSVKDRLNNGTVQVVLSTDNNLYFPTGTIGDTLQDGGFTIVGKPGSYAEIASNDGNVFAWASDTNYGNPVGGGFSIGTDSTALTGGYVWTFGNDGLLHFPDGSIQPTAFTNNLDSYATNNFVNSNFFNLTGGIISGATRINNNLTVFGDLTATGTTTFANTVFSVTSSLSVVHIGSGPALYVGNNGDGDIASFYDLDQGIEVFHVGGNNGSHPNVGVKTSTPNVDLTVNGQISANNTIWSANGNSNNWNKAYDISTAYQGVSGTFATNTLLQSTSALLTPLTDFNNYKTSVAASTATLLPTTAYQNTSGSFATNTLLQGTSALLTPLTLTRTLTGQLVLDTDSRLSDNRYPTSHASSHGSNGSDSLTPDFLNTTAITVYGFTNNSLNGNYGYANDGGDPPQQLFINGFPVWYNGASDAYIWYKTFGGERWVITQNNTGDNTPVLSQYTSYTVWPFILASTEPVNWSNGVKLRQASLSPSSLSDIGHVGGSSVNEISRFAFYDHVHPLPTTQQLGAASQTDFNNYRTSVAATTATLLPTTIYQNASGSFVTNTLLQSTSALLTPLTLTRTLTSQLVLNTTINSLTGNWNSAYASTTALNLSSNSWNSLKTEAATIQIELPDNKDYILDARSSYLYTLSAIHFYSLSGTGNLTLKINNVVIPEFNQRTISNSLSTVYLTTNNIVSSNQTFTASVSNNAYLLDLIMEAVYIR